MKRALPGINIQYPISTLILEGNKSVETRTYTLPTKFLNQPMWLIETPGKSGAFSARIVAVITFGKPFKYRSKKAFYNDIQKHHVTEDSPWAWREKEKWGWPIIKIEKIEKPLPAPKRRGFVFTGTIEV